MAVVNGLGKVWHFAQLHILALKGLGLITLVQRALKNVKVPSEAFSLNTHVQWSSMMLKLIGNCCQGHLGSQLFRLPTQNDLLFYLHKS